MRQPRGESWKARAREREETVQARTVGITDLGAERVVVDKAQTYWPRLEGLASWFFRNANCQDTYKVLNKHFDKNLTFVENSPRSRTA
jgi:hypothetical protein